MIFPLNVLGEREEATGAGRRALAIADDLGDLLLQAEIRNYVGIIHFDRGEYRQTIDLNLPIVQTMQGDLVRYGTPGLSSVLARFWLTWCYAELGEFPDALAFAEEAVRIAEDVGQAYSRITAYFGAGVAHLRKGDTSNAIDWLEKALTLIRTSDIAAWHQWVASSLSMAYALTGRESDARSLEGEAIGPLDASRRPGPGAIWRVETHLLIGALDQASRSALNIMDVFRENRERARAAETSGLLGAIALASNPPDPKMAEAHYLDALGLATELEMRPLVARCHLGLGQVYRRAGERERAREHLHTALSMFRQMGMQFWPDEAQHELEELAGAAEAEPAPS